VEYGCVITLAICSTLIGSVLGIRLRFVVLPPIIVLGAACLAVISSAQGAALSQTIVPVVIFATLLQLGYLCTALLKHAVTPCRRATSLAGNPEASIKYTLRSDLTKSDHFALRPQNRQTINTFARDSGS